MRRYAKAIAAAIGALVSVSVTVGWISPEGAAAIMEHGETIMLATMAIVGVVYASPANR